MGKRSREDLGAAPVRSAAAPASSAGAGAAARPPKAKSTARISSTDAPGASAGARPSGATSAKTSSKAASGGKFVRAPPAAAATSDGEGGADGAAAAPVDVSSLPVGSREHAARGAASKEALLAHVDDLSSDDEAPRNTVGNVPLEWYARAGYDHIGYDVEGKRIAKKPSAGGDRIDAFLRSQDDPLAHRWTVYDEANDESVVLSKRDVALLRNLAAGSAAHPEFDGTSEAYNIADIYSNTLEIHPLSGGHEPKRRFTPSKWEVRRPGVALFSLAACRGCVTETNACMPACLPA